MFYAILAYHEEEMVESWTKEEDAALMAELLEVNDRLVREKVWDQLHALARHEAP